MPTSDRVQDVMQRADSIVVNDMLTGGGVLLPAQYERFIDYVTDTPTILKDVRTFSMSREKMEFDKMGFGSRVLRSPWSKTANAVAAGVPHHTPSNYGKATHAGPATNPMGELSTLAPADWATPTYGRVWIEVHKKVAEVRISYDTLENNIEKGNFVDHLMRLLTERIAMDTEEWILNADTTSLDPFLDDTDGLIKKALAAGHVVDATATSIATPMWFAGKRAIPPKYFRNGGYQIYTSPGVELDWRETLTNRPTSVGDQFLFNNGTAEVLGMPLRGCANIRETIVSGGHNNCTLALMLNPKNLMFGVFRDIMIETDKDIRAQEYIVVVSMKFGIQVDEPDAIGVITNILPKS